MLSSANLKLCRPLHSWSKRLYLVFGLGSDPFILGPSVLTRTNSLRWTHFSGYRTYYCSITSKPRHAWRSAYPMPSPGSTQSRRGPTPSLHACSMMSLLNPTPAAIFTSWVSLADDLVLQVFAKACFCPLFFCATYAQSKIYSRLLPPKALILYAFVKPQFRPLICFRYVSY